jgi:hypothetical protein
MLDSAGGKKYLVVARDYTTGWLEAKALVKNDSVIVARFLEKNVFARYGLLYKLLIDRGPKNKGLVEFLTAQFSIYRVVASAYHL